MKKYFFSRDIWNLFITNIYKSALFYVIFPPIFAWIKSSFWEGSTFQHALMELWSWLLSNFYFFIGSFVIVTVFFTLIHIAYLLRNPVKWNFEEPLGMSGGEKDGIYDWNVRAFKANGENKLYWPILKIEGYIEVHTSHLRFPLRLVNKDGQTVNSDELISLPSKEIIAVEAYFGKDIENYGAFTGTPTKEFLLKFTPFTFIVFINGREYHYTFSESELSKFIQDKSKRIEKPKKQVGVIYKKK